MDPTHRQNKEVPEPEPKLEPLVSFHPCFSITPPPYSASSLIAPLFDTPAGFCGRCPTSPGTATYNGPPVENEPGAPTLNKHEAIPGGG